MPESAVNSDVVLWIALNQIQGLGNASVCQLLTKFGSPDGVFSASISQLREIVDPAIVGAESACSRIARGRLLAMQRTDERELRELLVKLRAEHRDLDAEIVALELAERPDQLHVKRLKKRKLLLKDQITAVEDRLTPDIIA